MSIVGGMRVFRIACGGIAWKRHSMAGFDAIIRYNAALIH
uniref:Uncharacterized protein n=1 Tax=Nelumbo nucifera TaxID=4432 RepID=A0A822YVN0_NELNU|nr:TPA_asm: hypothetical protein HUJ06_007383 [Nelumbo nucifera]